MSNATDKYHELQLRLAENLLLPKARGGETWAIRNLLLLVAEAIADRAVLPDGVAGYVADSLRHIYDGMSPADAFGIKLKRGERDTRAARARAFKYADHVERLREIEKITLEAAVAKVAERYDASDNTVKKAWSTHHVEASRLIKLEIECLGNVMPIPRP